MLHKSKLVLALMLISVLVLVGATQNLAQAAAGDLFISEYIEGSSFNKAIEIYNGTGGPVDLAAGLYTLELYSNGSSTVSQSIAAFGYHCRWRCLCLGTRECRPRHFSSSRCHQ